MASYLCLRSGLLSLLDSVPASKMHQSAGLRKESRVCVPITGVNANAQSQAVLCIVTITNHAINILGVVLGRSNAAQWLN